MNCFRLLLSFFVLLQFTNLNAQDNPVSWQFELTYSDSGSFVVAKAEIESGWYVYSQFLESDDGPIPTQLVLSDSSLNLDKPTEEGQRLYRYDEMFGMDIKKFKKSMVIRQKIGDLQSDSVEGYIEFMTCNDEMCLPPRQISFKVATPK